MADKGMKKRWISLYVEKLLPLTNHTKIFVIKYTKDQWKLFHWNTF